ncbi:hypothetical protein FOZ61_005129 [Perkinsus olseni]|uniref:Uncharacterized protein n=1 Tax=Perkinsus olseni TaxID=32597 RepID=A0A7J6LIS2_PEROL|nr:hypothetical protein FOZ61_005129 [Perkinsus olseni]
MIAHHPSYLICVAFALLPLTVGSLKSQRHIGVQTDPEKGMADTPQLEYRWATPSEGRPDYTFVAYDPQKQAIVGELSFTILAKINEAKMDEELVDRGVPTEMLEAMVKAIPGVKFEVSEVERKWDGDGSFEEEVFEDVGFFTASDVCDYTLVTYNIPRQENTL